MKRLVLFVLLLAGAVRAQVRLPAIISDHMVIQAGKPATIWGWAEPGEQVALTLGESKAAAVADGSGRWSAQLPALAASASPAVLTVAGKNTLTVQDVLVGEVWLCSGQSNMAMTVNRAMNYDKEQPAADLPAIRMFITARTPHDQPQSDCAGKWVVCSPQTVGSFSATAYFFGRDLHAAIRQPVGLINSSVGGTPIQAWTSLSAQQAKPELKPILDAHAKTVAGFDPVKSKAAYDKQKEKWKADVAKAKATGSKNVPPAPRAPQDPRSGTGRPGCLFNGMIAPLVPYAFRGALWYQGEGNAGSLGHLYGPQLSTLIADWRTRFAQGDFPFAWVQLPNFMAPQKEPVETGGWVVVQEQMLKTLSVPHTGMAITVDIGMEKDIHPVNKQEVGRRLALWALHDVYGRTDQPASGPIPKSHKIEGESILITFDHAHAAANQGTSGLKAFGGGPLKGFAIAGADRKFVWADAVIVNPHTIKVSSPQVKQPLAVRYAWASNPVGNLRNAADLPATPFRTDDWPLEVKAR